MNNTKLNFSGLTRLEVDEARTRYGWNTVRQEKENSLLSFLKRTFTEPMVVLLLVAASLYFIHGDLAEGGFMIAAIALISFISFYQESRSQKALEALRVLTRPKANVIREGKIIEIPTPEIVVGDFLVSEEGSVIAADGKLVQANDLTVNESTLTGESLPVEKNPEGPDNHVFQGTYVVSGLGVCIVTHIGEQTKMGQIGVQLQRLGEEESPLQRQINRFVKLMAITGALFFFLIWGIRILRSGNVLESLLEALTLAMSILPEEIPVAFATFMALGAWRLSRLGIIVKQARTVETLGSATIICVDKTGTITKNQMIPDFVYVHQDKRVYNSSERDKIQALIECAMWASEPIPFDPMEHEIHRLYGESCATDARPEYRLVHEYPLGGKPPLMTHIFQNTTGHRIVAAKGAPEAILNQSILTVDERKEINLVIETLANKGYRLLGVGDATSADGWPSTQQEFRFSFKGLIAFRDPPKENIERVLQEFYRAGIQVKIITGDNPVTTAAIAKEVGLRGADNITTGDTIMQQSPEELKSTVQQVNIFARMFPEAKLKIITTLKDMGHVVAMTGDGINDAPALRAAHIGIAMGKHGSEIAKDASALILADDDLARMVDAISMGRKIYGNLKKAIQYIISIHIPIILVVFIPLAMGWPFAPILMPVHVIFLELLMGPTCSIIYENEPVEGNVMLLKPRTPGNTFFTWKELSLSLVQGTAITAGLLFIYGWCIEKHYPETAVTAMIFITLITSNIFLTLVNRSFYFSLLSTLKYRNNLIPLVIGASVMLTSLIFLFSSVRTLFHFSLLPMRDTVLSIGTGAVAVLWFEAYKWIVRRKNPDLNQ